MHKSVGATARPKSNTTKSKKTPTQHHTRSKAPFHTKSKHRIKSTSGLTSLLPINKTTIFSHTQRRKFSSFDENNNDNEQDNSTSGTSIQFKQPTNPLNDTLANTSLDQLLKTRNSSAQQSVVAKRMTKQRLEQEKKQNDKLVDTLYGDFVDANDRGDGLVWAGSVDEFAPAPQAEEEAVPLHEKILQLYLNNYQQQENRELEVHFDGNKEDNEITAGRDLFLQQMVNSMSPKNYSRFVHSFRLCIQKLRTLLAKHQQQKQQLKDNIHMITNFSQQESALQQRYQSELQEAQITFFRQAAKLFAEDADVFMPQLVIHLSSLTLTQLENHRERQSTSHMNLYSCGFWLPNEASGPSAFTGTNTSTSAFREQFNQYLTENNPTLNSPHPLPASQVALEAYTFPVRIANKLYSELDIHTDQTSPLFFNKLQRVHQRSHKVFVSNIPSTLTTRELMALFGNCGVLNAAEIYRDKLNQETGLTLEQTQTQKNHQGAMPGDDSLYQGLSLSKKEAILQANAAALTIDISDIALGHFTSSFKSDRLLVPSHVIDSNLVDHTILSHLDSQPLLSSDGQKLDPIASIFQQSDGSSSQVEAFPEDVKDQFNSDLAKFENLHTKRQQRQQKKMIKAIRDGKKSNPDGVDEQMMTYQHGEESRVATTNNNDGQTKFSKKGSTDIQKFALRDLHSPVYGFLYFSTAAGKRRALRQSLQVFGLSTASGYAMTTHDAADKNQLVISGIHRSMTGADVAHFIRETLEEFMPLTKQVASKSFISTNSMEKNEDMSKESIIDRVYVPRSYARSLGTNDLFNNNRGYAIITFDSHETAFNAFRYLQNSTITFSTPAVGNPSNSANSVEKIDGQFNPSQISDQFNTNNNATYSSPSDSSQAPSITSRLVNVHWRKEKNRVQKQPHPITSYFPTFEKPKQRLFQKVSEQLKNALPQGKMEVAQDQFGNKL